MNIFVGGCRETGRSGGVSARREERGVLRLWSGE